MNNEKKYLLAKLVAMSGKFCNFEADLVYAISKTY